MDMESYEIFKSLAIIIIAAKLFGICARKINVPQVVGEIIAGLLIGPSILGWVDNTAFISQMAEIGVILLMFSAGLGTDLKELRQTGTVALLLACAGVLVPLIGGTAYYMIFYNVRSFSSPDFIEAVFVGTIMTATSVSITVETLKELGFLKSRLGTTILSAAIIDDVIGIIVLTFVISFRDPSVRISAVFVQTALFFIFAIGVGFVAYKLFQVVDKRYPHTRRIPIAGLALCFAMAYIAEALFGIADITGAYVAGIILCSISDSDYIARKMDINSYMLFGPIFFASIGLKTDLADFSLSMLWFSIGFMIVALAGKVIGCTLMALACKFNFRDSLTCGVGMMTRGEVALIVAQKGLSVGLISPVYFSAVILLILVSSILTPVLLKLLLSGSQVQPVSVDE